ncbi:unnamed protein product [Strongylus vulgaris]|uniref:Uncharacterized protein n=1 Tax=Strongylus vulgaris TaxID=40348 RepID=A0A3P7LLD4_STRVU|nr:unnamed protein product [Strongylus vulgaris]
MRPPRLSTRAIAHKVIRPTTMYTLLAMAPSPADRAIIVGYQLATALLESPTSD